MPRIASWVCLPQDFLSAGPLLMSLGCLGEGQHFYFDMTNINAAFVTVNKCKGRFDRVNRYTKLKGPLISSTAGYEAHDAVLPLNIHYTVDDLVERTIAAVGYDQIICLFGGSAGQFQRVPAILLKSHVSMPAGRR